MQTLNARLHLIDMHPRQTLEIALRDIRLDLRQDALGRRLLRQQFRQFPHMAATQYTVT